MNIGINDPRFETHLLNLVQSEAYKYKFLRQTVRQAMQGQVIFYDDSILNIDGEGWILIIHSDSLLIYGKNWTLNQIEEVKRSFNLNRLTNYLMTGDAPLIKALIEYYPVDNFDIEMERIMYHTNAVIPFVNDELEITAGEEKDIPILAPMLQQYYHEEYEGENDKTIEEMSARILQTVEQEKIYVLKNADNVIVSFCTIIDPDIGIFFTNEEFRNSGYGRIILSHCSMLLLKRNKEIYLMTVKGRPASNAAVAQVGFRPYYEYAYIRINKTD